MKAVIIYLILAYLAMAVQSIFFYGIKPDLVLILVIYYAVKHGQLKGMAFGALTGLLIDVASGFIIGPNILSKALAAFLARAVRENLFQWNIIVSTIVVTVFLIMDIVIVYVCFETFLKMSFVNRPWGISFREVFYTIMAAMALYPVFNKKEDWWDLLRTDS